MKPVDQTIFTAPGGNCFAAALASLLELPLDEVPHVVDEPGDWTAHVNEWLRPRGLSLIWRHLEVTVEDQTLVFGDPPPGLHILIGRFPGTSILHAVVARGAEIVHDPHPRRGGLDTRQEVWVVVPLDPALCYSREAPAPESHVGTRDQPAQCAGPTHARPASAAPPRPEQGRGGCASEGA